MEPRLGHRDGVLRRPVVLDRRDDVVHGLVFFSRQLQVALRGHAPLLDRLPPALVRSRLLHRQANQSLPRQGEHDQVERDGRHPVELHYRGKRGQVLQRGVPRSRQDRHRELRADHAQLRVGFDLPVAKKIVK